jgi:hypothetical protein
MAKSHGIDFLRSDSGGMIASARRADQSVERILTLRHKIPAFVG